MKRIKLIITIFILISQMGMAGQIQNGGTNWQLRVARDPFDLVATFNYAQILEQQNKNDEALVQIERVAMLRPREDFYLPVKANLLEKKMRYAEALLIWRRLAHEHSKDKEAFRRLYHSSVHNKEWQLAYDSAKTLVQKFQDAPVIWHERMALLASRHLNRQQDSAEHWWQIWLLNKNDLALFQCLSTLKLDPDEKAYQAKIKLVKDRRILDRNNLPDGLKLILAMENRQKNNHAVAISSLLEIKAKDLMTLRDQELAFAYWEIEHYDMAGAALAKLYEKSPNPVIGCQLGKLFYKLGERKKLLALMQKLDHQIADFNCWDMKARVLAMAGETGLALEMYKDWLKQMPDDAQAQWGKALVHLMRSEWPKAIESMEVLDKFPNMTSKRALVNKLNHYRVVQSKKIKGNDSAMRMPASIGKKHKAKP
jgi:tetratricopeptide (TPR) repeat protein